MNYVDCAKMTDFVKITMENGGEIVIKLDKRYAPLTVSNFQKLVSQNFYNGLIFHRVIKGFMIQGGDPQGTGIGGSKDTIKGEFSSNGVNNPLSHKRGVISMARSRFANSASSQFFICHGDSAFLDGQYASFGEVVSGMDTVDYIANCPIFPNDQPKTKQIMQKVGFVSEVLE